MIPLSFLYAVALLAIGAHGLLSADDPGAIRQLAMPAFFFGGAVLISSFFALREPRHGLAGASFLAFLAFLTNAANLLGPLIRGGYDWAAAPHRLATLTLLASALYLAAAVSSWRRSRRRPAIEELTETR